MPQPAGILWLIIVTPSTHPPVGDSLSGKICRGDIHSLDKIDPEIFQQFKYSWQINYAFSVCKFSYCENFVTIKVCKPGQSTLSANPGFRFCEANIFWGFVF